MKKRKFLISIILLAGLLTITGCHKNSEGEQENKNLINVQIQEVRKYNLNETIAYSGTIEESETIPLSFSTMGSVLQVKVNEGEFVKQGQILAVLNNESSKNAYDMSSASLKQAEDAYNRLKPMYDNGNLPEIKLIEVETGLQQAKAATAIAKKNLDDCNLYSPVDGIVGTRSIDSGMNVMPGFTAINIVKIEKVFAKVSVSENEISLIKKGQKAFIKIAALGGKEFEGKVEEIGVLADLLAHTYKIKIALSNSDRVIKPGMICEVNIEKSEPYNGVVVPNESVQVDEKGKTFVFSVNENKNKNNASRKYVVTGKLLKNGIEIKDGLKEGDFVVISGQQKLVDNSLVRIVN